MLSQFENVLLNVKNILSIIAECEEEKVSRLPQPGGDVGQWGAVLNDYLLVAHNSDGSFKDVGVIAAKYTKPSTGIPKSDLDADVQASLDAGVSGIAPDATVATKGIVRLSGDLTGDALSPLIAPGRVSGGSGGAIASGTITNSNIHVSAAIAKSKLAPLAITDTDISVGAAIVQSKVQNLVTDLAAKAPLVHVHGISEVTGLQTSLDAKAAASHTHQLSGVIGLEAALDAKAETVHTHSADTITDFSEVTATVIGDRIQGGTNVTVAYDAPSGITTISATGGSGGGSPSSTVETVAGKTGDVVLDASDIISGSFTTNRIPNLDSAKITSGTLAIGRIPTGTTSTTVALGNHTHSGFAASTHTHTAGDIAGGTFDIARIPTGSTGTTVSLGNHTHGSLYAALAHTHDDRYYTETESDALLSSKLNSSEKGSANGVATLDSEGKLPVSQLPALAVKDTYTVSSQAAMLALTAERGDIAIRTDTGRTYVLSSDSPSVLNDWKELIANSGSPSVTSVAGRTGAVTLTKSDVGLTNVDNTSDANKPVSTATQAVIDGIRRVAVNAQTTSYTLVLSDEGKAIQFTNASGVSLTVPTNSSVAFAIGTIIEVVQMGAGSVTLAPGSGVSLLSADALLSTRTQYSVVSLRKSATNTWMVAGDLV